MATVFSRLETRGTVDAVVRRIVAAVKSGELRAGDRLPSERALAEQVGVSRSTVRKAIRVLTERDLLETRGGTGSARGTVVKTEIVPPDLSGEALQIRPAEVASVLEARRLVEPRVAQLAGFLMDNDDYEAIKRIIDLQRETLDEPERVRELDPQFHLAIARATHNPTIVAVMQTVLARLELTRSIVPVGPNVAQATLEMHERTLDALASRDQARIERIMDEHLQMMEVAWERESGLALTRTAPDFLMRPRPDGRS